jgi:hypothetical protein
MTDDEPTPEDLARPVAMSGVLRDRDRLAVVAALRRRDDIDEAVNRHPAGGRDADNDRHIGA